MKSWLAWTIAGLLVVAIGGSMFALGRMSGESGGDQRQPRIEVPRPSPEQEELQKIKIAASEVKIEEAAKTVDGWVVRVAAESSNLDPMKLSKDAMTFFQDLSRAGVDVVATSYVVRTNDLKDVWGNKLKDVSLFRIGLDKTTFEKINWGGFDPNNFPRVTDDFWMHDLVVQKMREQQNQGGQGGGGQGGQGGQGQGSQGQGGQGGGGP